MFSSIHSRAVALNNKRNMKKLDKYHYHELLHTINIIQDMCEDHLLKHYLGQE